MTSAHLGLPRATLITATQCRPATRQPRVLLVGQGTGGGGAENRFRLIAAHLYGGTADAAVLQMHAGGAHLHMLDLGWSSRFSYPQVIARLRAHLRCHAYDAVMSFGMFPNIVSALASRLAGGERCLIFNEITRPRAAAMAIGAKRGGLYPCLMRWLYPLCDVLTANSIDGLIEASELARRPLEPAHRTPNLADIDELRARASAETGSLPDRAYFICICRLEYMKRMDTVISAWALLNVNTRPRLVIVGDGVALPSLETQVMASGLNAQVEFRGAVENPMPLLKGARGFILASEYEGFSNSVLEAMCLDVPVITSFCSSDARKMCDEGAALGFDVGDVMGLVDRIRQLITTPDVSARLVQSAKLYRAPHLLPDAIHTYERLIEHCTAKKHSRMANRTCAT